MVRDIVLSREKYGCSGKGAGERAEGAAEKIRGAEGGPVGDCGEAEVEEALGGGKQQLELGGCCWGGGGKGGEGDAEVGRGSDAPPRRINRRAPGIEWWAG